MKSETTQRSPWYWVPSLYFAEGIPYVIVMLISVVFYKRMGISNADIALYTSWLYLPWVIKPLWSPVVDILRTKRFWIITTQLIIGAGLGGLVLAIPVPGFFKVTLGFFWLLAFSSSTHDIAADGFYMLGLSQKKQAWFVGIRSTFYRLAMITGQGFLIIFAGYLESSTGLPSVDAIVASQPVSAVTPTVTGANSVSNPDLHIVLDPPRLHIPIEPKSKAFVDSVRSEVKAQNGVMIPQKTSGAKSEETAGFWSNWVSGPLERVLRKWFGTEQNEPVSRMQGNVGIIRYHLSGPPEDGEKVVVNFGRISGDKSISLLEGGRSEFTAENWDHPVMALVQIDPKLKTGVSAKFEARAGNIPLAWMITFGVLAVLFILFFLYHRFILPKPSDDTGASSISWSEFFQNFGSVFAEYFTKERIWISITFILLYRLGEAQLVKVAPLFMLDVQEAGGMALTTGQYGFVYGTVGMLMLTLGGILGGIFAARDGLKKWVWWMAIAINIPNAVYVYLSAALPDNFWIINGCVGLEQFGYGFGFTAFMLYMILVAEGKHKTAHYAICTGFMALGMMIPGMFSGWLQEIIGYHHFFIWVLIATIPGFILIKYLPIDPEFGKKEE